MVDHIWRGFFRFTNKELGELAAACIEDGDEEEEEPDEEDEEENEEDEEENEGDEEENEGDEEGDEEDDNDEDGSKIGRQESEDEVLSDTEDSSLLVSSSDCYLDLLLILWRLSWPSESGCRIFNMLKINQVVSWKMSSPT